MIPSQHDSLRGILTLLMLGHVRIAWTDSSVDGPAKIRIVVPAGQVSLSGDLTYTDAGVVGYPCTVEAFADSSGNQAYHYLDNGIFA